MPRWINLPNLLTLLRLLLVPIVVQAIVAHRHLEAILLFVLAAFTDLFDGAVARRFQTATQAGAYLDPIADKCLLSGVFLALAWGGFVPWWVVAIIFGRDMYILLAVAIFLLFTPIRKFPPSVWGKASTFVQIVTAVTWMSRNLLQTPFLDRLASAMLFPCMAFTVWSGVHYTWRGWQLARKH